MTLNAGSPPPFESSERSLPLDRRLSTLVVDGTMRQARAGSWILKRKGRSELTVETEGASGARIDVSDASADAVLYARTVLATDVAQGSILTVRASLRLDADGPCSLDVLACKDAELTATVASGSVPVRSGEPAACEVTLPIGGRVHVAVQLTFAKGPLRAHGFEIGATLVGADRAFRPISFNIHGFGDYLKASARLRAWKLARELICAGHDVKVAAGPCSRSTADVHVFQKIRPFKLLGRMQNREKQTLVFDFDDNYFLDDRGNSSEFIAFINQMDVVTVGSEHLREIASRYHPNVVLIDNPVDVDDTDVRRDERPWTGRVGWFGAPENLGQLALIDHDGPVTTVTRGGDVEYDHGTLDETLTRFDLLLFPLELDRWSAAKNANRMVKALALGVPVLATDTPEHRRAAELVGLPDRYLVGAGQSWSARIEDVMSEYDSIREEIADVRLRVLKVYDPKVIAEQVFSSVASIGKRGAPAVRRRDERLGSVALFVVNDRDGSAPFETFAATSEIDLSCFGNVTVFDGRMDENAALAFEDAASIVREPDPLRLYERLERHLDDTPCERVLIVDGKVRLLASLLEGLRFDVDVLALETTPFGGATGALPKHRLDAYRVLTDRVAPSMLMVEADWLRRSGLRASELLSWMHHAIWFEALVSSDTSVACTAFPVGVHRSANKPDNVSERFSRFCRVSGAVEAHDLPNYVNQWGRVSHDIVHTMMARHPEFSVGVAARMIQSATVQAEKAA